MKITLVSDIQGNWDQLQAICDTLDPEDIIIHTGNFGFWDKSTIHKSDINYLKQFIPFLTKLSDPLIQQLINKFNILNNNGLNHDITAEIKSKIIDKFDHMTPYLNGTSLFKNRIYTIYGPLDDPVIVDKLLNRDPHYSIPNLHIIDYQHNYIIPPPSALGTTSPGPSLKIYGLGGKFKFVNLFNQGQIGNVTSGNINGNFGELWITLLQISKFYQLNSENLNTINLFVSYNCNIKTPLIEYLSMVTNANFTISSSLHFKFPIIGNEMSFNHNLELFKLKFCKFRIKLGELFKLIKSNLSSLNLDPLTLNQLQIGLNIFDKIPIIQSSQIIPLKLTNTPTSQNFNGLIAGLGSNTNEIIGKINEMYFENFYNLWHLNLCDININNKLNLLTLSYDQGIINIHECINSGLDFSYKGSNKLSHKTSENTLMHEDLFDNEIDPILSFDKPQGLNIDRYEPYNYYENTNDENYFDHENPPEEINDNENDAGNEGNEGYDDNDEIDTSNEYDNDYGSTRGSRGNGKRGRGGSRGRATRGLPRGRSSTRGRGTRGRSRPRARGRYK